ncbi:hypothetical protein C7121_06265 [Paenibacillus glucanolyticus]|jgi:DNA-binding transcriptional ArsR family regulator|uniref:hypothetical protein n=1 Tax=Paenibacillus glucanolyticus TaxID=59843 RepID=UPI0003E2B402|nr:hypothetical protein [Paenibacillus glucanolyticus]ANA80162.1 hypothetical protein A3958_09275 [Paenibacillus glucanolyticus]AVV55771.1 hypothetical protein C7121_06265 [Paenibacillus glucanolyticus]ETT38571.1 hypothetical protein C169_13212 [Paenibacillus sp. FSL R5-808]
MDVIDRLFDFYIIQHRRYLLQFPGGYYRTIPGGINPLRRYHLEYHLEGKSAVGTFAGQYFTKLITFDVDFEDADFAKWVTYKLAATLDAAGIYTYLISFSGSKGYHLDICLADAIAVKNARRFFDFIVTGADLTEVQGGQVEYRPSGMQGVKLPLGYHQKTGAYCGFCTVEDGLRIMGPEESHAYFLAAKKTEAALILDTIAGGDGAYSEREAADMEEAIGRHRPLETYEQSESYTLSRAAERYNVGLTRPGQRHKSFLLLARLFNHNGVDRAEARAAITEWFAWQNPDYYDSSREFCAKDLAECVDYVYDRDLTLAAQQKDITVTFTEIDDIMRKCPQKNQKALAYAMLVHSKRWADPGGTFYMTYTQMASASGMDERTARRQVDKLEKAEVIEIVRRDQRKRGTFLKKPNVYRMLLDYDEDSGVFEVTEEADFVACLTHFYDRDQLRKTLPRKQFESLIGAVNTDNTA